MRIAIDTETALASEEQPIPALVSVAIASSDETLLFHQKDPELFGVLSAIFGSHHAVFAFAPFDVFVLWRWRPEIWPTIKRAYDEGRIVDILTNQRMIDTATGEQRPKDEGVSLAVLAHRWLDLDLAKGEDTWRLRYAELSDVPIDQWPSDAREYALKDARVTWDVDAKQAIHLPYLVDGPHQAQASLCLYRQTLIGVETDPERVRALDLEFLHRIRAEQQACLDTGMARWARKDGRLQIVKNQKIAREMMFDISGQTSIAQEELDAAKIPEGHPLKHYQRLGSIKTQHSKNVLVLRHPRIRTSYVSPVDSGRVSSRNPGDPWVGTNLQNLPRDGGVRGCLRAPPDHSFIVSDYGALELVTLAQIQLDWFGRSALADMLREGRDPHAEFAMQIFGGGGTYDPKNPEHKRARQGAKAWNFGKPGAMGQAKFIAWAWNTYQYEVTPKRERELTALWKRLFPEIEMYWARIRTMERLPGLYNIVHVRSGRHRSKIRFPEAANSFFQGLGSDVSKRSLWRLFEASLDPTSLLYRCPQVLTVHDEHVTVCPDDRAAEALHEQERIMIAAAAEYCPDVPIKVESALAKNYCKP